MGASQRNKGASAERELAAILTDAMGYIVKRRLEGPRGHADDIQVGQYRIESKRRARHSVLRFMEQAKRQADSDIPVVALREDGDREWYFLLRQDEFIKLIRGEV